ncbi:MAG: prolipoprotein diacylglyceryl transferase [Bacteroidetes bacterium]|nr:prolipoprotein diacylglyceryl transferase [Bacteroidota bacterium]
MYPNLYYAFKDLMGVDWPFLRFFNTFGFFVALAFGAAATSLSYELRRKSKQGLFRPEETTILVGKPASLQDILFNFLLGFLLGFKLLALFLLDKDQIVDPPSFIFSGEGNFPLGLLLGLFFAIMKWREKEKQKLEKPEKRIIRIWPEDRVGDITLLALVFGLAGAKLFDIFENWSDFLKRPSDYLFSPAGLTMYGGLICAAIAIGVYARRHKIGFLNLSDAIAPGLMLAYGIGRLGCQFSGDGDWGVVSDLSTKPFLLPDWAWSYTYPHNVIEAGIPIPGCEGPYCNALPAGVYPTALYEAVVSILLAFVLFYLKNQIKVSGILFSIYLIFNGLERFAIEKIRVNNQLDILGFHPTQAEVISSFLFLTGLALAFYLKQSHKTSVES